MHNGTTIVIKEIDTSVQFGKVYNLTVANTHNYYVGQDGVLVHNIDCFFEKKIMKQLSKRGWNEQNVTDLVNNPHRTVKVRDNRWKNDGTGRRDDSATVFIDKNGSYVVRNDVDGSIVQVSNRNDPNWKNPF